MKNFLLFSIFYFLTVFMLSCGDDLPENCSAENPKGACPQGQYCSAGVCVKSLKKCEPECSDDEICRDGLCIPLKKEVDCKDEAPENAESIIEKVEVEYDAREDKWSEPKVCDWNCTEGYKKTIDGKRCILMQESDYCKQIECGEHAYCKVENKTPFCACDEGYELNDDNVSCSDINECELNVCEQVCTNTEGGFECSCRDGFVLALDGKSCEDIDECALNFDDCSENANCINKVGTFECECKSGYEGDGITCNLIDICSPENNPCNQPHKTVCKDDNTDGMAECYCDDGYQLNESGDCENINECDPNHLLANCNPNATCIDTEGGYICECNEGYEGDGITCNEID